MKTEASHQVYLSLQTLLAGVIGILMSTCAISLAVLGYTHESRLHRENAQGQIQVEVQRIGGLVRETLRHPCALTEQRRLLSILTRSLFSEWKTRDHRDVRYVSIHRPGLGTPLYANTAGSDVHLPLFDLHAQQGRIDALAREPEWALPHLVDVNGSPEMFKVIQLDKDRLVLLRVGYAYNSMALKLQNTLKRYTLSGLGFVIFSVASALLVAFIVASPIARLAGGARRVAAHDLTAQRFVKEDIRTRELLSLAETLDALHGNLTEIIGGIGGSVGHLGGLANSAKSTATRIAAGTSCQTEALDGAATSIDNLAAQISDITSNAHEVSRVADENARNTEGMSRAVTETNVTVNDLVAHNNDIMMNSLEASRLSERLTHEAGQGKEAARNAIESVLGIQESAEAIHNRSQVITEISAQTNLLALNAAIEAARAGDLGRGFGVVAEEIRKLATKSNGAARDIARLIQASLERALEGVETVKSAAHILEDMIRGIQELSELIEMNKSFTERQAERIGRISDNMQELNDFAPGINSASQRQAFQSNQILSKADRQSSENQAILVKMAEISEMAKISTQESAELESMSESLLQEARNLQSLVARFTLS